MFKKLTKLALVAAVALPVIAFANQEMQAKQACETFAKAHPNFPGCTNNNLSSATWSCVSKKVSANDTFREAMQACVKDAPSLTQFSNIKNNPQATQKICEKAVPLFEKYNPNDTSEIHNPDVLCGRTTRSTKEWACMLSYAKDKNSFHFSANQCFQS